MSHGDPMRDGAIKQKSGEAISNDQLEAEGEAQQPKGDEQARETKDRAEANVHKKKAAALAESNNGDSSCRGAPW